MLDAYLTDIRDHDMISPRFMADCLRVPIARLARLAHVNRKTMTAKPEGLTVQAKLRNRTDHHARGRLAG